MQLKNISMEHIDWSDIRYCFQPFFAERSEDPTTEYAFSEEWIEPSVVCATGVAERWTLVDGHSQAWSAYRAGQATLPALCLQGAETDPYRCLCIAYRRHISRQPLTLLEKAALIVRLQNTAQGSASATLETWLKRLALPPQKTILAPLRRLEEWPEILRREAQAADLNPAVLLSLADRPMEEAACLTRFLIRHCWSHSRQKEILRLLLDLMQIQNQSAESVVAEAESAALTLPAHIPDAQRSEAAHRRLRRMRYPHLCRAEEQFLECRKKLSLPPSVHLQEPADFEGENYRLQITFRNKSELDGALRKLGKIVDSPGLDSLWLLT